MVIVFRYRGGTYRAHPRNQWGVFMENFGWVGFLAVGFLLQKPIPIPRKLFFSAGKKWHFLT